MVKILWLVVSVCHYLLYIIIIVIKSWSCYHIHLLECRWGMRKSLVCGQHEKFHEQWPTGLRTIQMGKSSLGGWCVMTHCRCIHRFECSLYGAHCLAAKGMDRPKVDSPSSHSPCEVERYGSDSHHNCSLKVGVLLLLWLLGWTWNFRQRMAGAVELLCSQCCYCRHSREEHWCAGPWRCNHWIRFHRRATAAEGG